MHVNTKILQGEYNKILKSLLFTVAVFYNLKTYLLTYSMEHGPSWEANWFAASQEIPRVLWNPKIPHRTHKRPTLIPILSQPNPVLTPTSHLLKIHPNIILPATPGSPQRSLSLLKKQTKNMKVYYLSNPLRCTYKDFS
jgi:hypothetical protein